MPTGTLDAPALNPKKACAFGVSLKCVLPVRTKNPACGRLAVQSGYELEELLGVSVHLMTPSEILTDLPAEDAEQALTEAKPL